MKKTLLLCFIHGFKGGDDTFGSFPEYLRAIVSHSLPNINIRVIVYPRYETRGDLVECVNRFIKWLLEKVTDLEAANGTSHSIFDSPVRVLLIGHSMGGIVAADTVLALSSNPASTSIEKSKNLSTDIKNLPFFPHIQGVLGFDTPYLGISPGILASLDPSVIVPSPSLRNVFWGFNTTQTEDCPESKMQRETLVKSPSEALDWKSWCKTAAIVGVTAALAVGGGITAYKNSDFIKQGWSWIGSHLEFVGCLMKEEELLKRYDAMNILNKNKDVGFGNIYTRLGKRAAKSNESFVAKILSNRGTFCALPKPEDVEIWREAVNDAATDELSAHIKMFHPYGNPGYYAMSQKAKNLIVLWTNKEWYSTSSNDE